VIQHDSYCLLGGKCRSTETGEHWEIWTVGGMVLSASICEACVDYCDCERVAGIRLDERSKIEEEARDVLEKEKPQR
jgi:hypothetical protein